MSIRRTWASAGSQRQLARRVQRDTIAFNAGDAWGVGTWDPEVEVDIIKQGEE